MSYQTNAVSVENYMGKTFLTQNKHNYGITKKGEFKGRRSIQGAKVKYVAGIEHYLYSIAVDCLSIPTPESLKRLDDLIKKYGKKIKPGLHLIASLTEEAAMETKRCGIVTSPIKKIH